MSKEALREIEKLRVRISGLRRTEEEATISFGLCLDRWQRLLEAFDRGEESLENMLRLRLEAYEALDAALEGQSKMEHERSHVAESLGLLLLGAERAFHEHLRRGKEP